MRLPSEDRPWVPSAVHTPDLCEDGLFDGALDGRVAGLSLHKHGQQPV
jgi:hypothetical protein